MSGNTVSESCHEQFASYILVVNSKNKVIDPYKQGDYKNQQFTKCMNNIGGPGHIIILNHENAGKIELVHFIKLHDYDYGSCEDFIPEHWSDFVMSEPIGNYTDLTYTQFYKTSMGERQYLNTMKNILENGEKRIGRNGGTLSTFGQHMKFDLRNGFPLLTTKKMFFRGIVEELLFFLRGETDSSKLEEKNVKIWSGNTSAEFLKNRGLDYAPGVMGPMYGFQWRFFDGEYDVNEKGRPYVEKGCEVRDSVDQLSNVIELIKNDPTSRRILMTDYNPKQAEEGVLYPCHSIILQFYVQDGFLDMFCYNRSQDFFLGVPFNIASSSLLQTIIAKVTGLTPRYFNLSMGDVHIYDGHIDAVKEQLSRIPYNFPEMRINKEISSVEDIEDLEYEDFIVSGYFSHSRIKSEMVA